MSEPEKKPDDKDLKENKDDKKETENLFRILDDLLSHTNSTRRLFLIFIASALFFAPVALVLGGVLLGHPAYNIRHLGDTEEGIAQNIPPQRIHLQVIGENGTVLKDMPAFQYHPPREGIIYLGTSIFIVISIAFASILLYVAIKEFRFFSKWNQRFTKYKSLRDKIDKELEDD